MKVISSLTYFLLLLALFTGCAGKDMKKYGGELALNGGGGNPIMAGVGLVVGGTIYSIGSLVEDNNSEGRRAYLNNAIQLVYDTAKHSLNWFKFFSGKYNHVIEDIALETLSSEALTDLAQLKAARERSK
mgnify:CR=1 FL=1